MVVAANVAEQTGARRVLERVWQRGRAVCRLRILWADGGFGGEPLSQWVMDCYRWVIQVVLRPAESRGF